MLKQLYRSLPGPTLTFLASTLAMYLGVVYVFSFSQAAASSRYAIQSAILMMDVLIVLQLLSGRTIVPNTPVRSGVPGWLRPLFIVVAHGSFLCVVLLHVDYAFARYRGAEDGVTGTLLALKAYLLVAQLSCVLFGALSKARWRMPAKAMASVRTEAADVLLFSLALVPIVNYLAHNRSEFSLVSAIEYLAFFLACPLAALVLVRLFQLALNAIAVSVPVVAGLTFVYYSMPQVSALLKQPVEALFPVHIGLALLVPGVAGVMYLADRRATTKAVALFSVCSMAGSFLHAGYTRQQDDPSRASLAPAGIPAMEQSALDRLLSSPVKRRPDVYLLVYDGYAPAAMMKHYGASSESVTEYLSSRGFKVYEQAYSLFMASRPSMTSLMDMRIAPQAGIGGDTSVNRFFRHHGYKTYLILNSYLLQGGEPMAVDAVFPQWRYRAGLGALYRGIGGGEFKSEIVFQDSDPEEWLSAKRLALTEESAAPKLLYAHSGFPGHSQNSGRCLEDETARYLARLTVANEEMKDDIETILGSRRDAVIIVAGDHGPYLTGDCLYMARHRPDELAAVHLADRYGAKLAIRWPDDDAGRFDRIALIQDVFFAVSAYLLGDDRVWLHRLPSETVGYGGIPDGAVRDGMVMVGKDKGQPLFAALR